MHLLRLPAEILLEIAAELNDEGDISRFSRTNTWLRSVLDGFLYKFDAQIRHGKDKDAKGRSIALHWAALFGNFGILDKALRAGANIDCIFSTGDVSLPLSVGFFRGRTPFHQAVLAGNGAMVKYLLKLNVDVNKISGWSRSPIFCAISGGFSEICEAIFESPGLIQTAQTMPTKARFGAL